MKNGDFSAVTAAVSDEDDAMPDHWLFTSSEGAACTRQKMPEDHEAWSLMLTCPPVAGDKQPGTMLAQYDVPVAKGRWYRISFKARAEGLASDGVNVTIANTATWQSFFEYQRFVPGPRWKQFSFEVQSNDTADRQTRFQIWYSGPGRLWLADVRVQPIRDPTEGRWHEGFYLDVPESWDDPYRFFRW